MALRASRYFSGNATFRRLHQTGSVKFSSQPVDSPELLQLALGLTLGRGQLTLLNLHTGLAGQQFDASGKLTPSIFMMKEKALPPSPQPKQ
jgi:hypothetical protein